MQFLITTKRIKFPKRGHEQKRKKDEEQQHARQNVSILRYLAVTEQQEYLIALLCSSPVQCNEQEIMILGDKDPPLLLISTFSLYQPN